MKMLLKIALFMGLAVAPVVSQQVSADWVRGTDFSRFKTYSWRLSPQPVQDAVWNARIISYVDEQLSAKGLKKQAPDQPPDLIVRYIAGVQRPVLPSGASVADASGMIGKTEQGYAGLRVYLADPRSSAVVWYALATDALSDLSDKDVTRVQHLIQEMFRHYPPEK